MSRHIILLSIPGLRQKDLASMPQLTNLTAGGAAATLTSSFPCVTWPSQTNMLTGKLPNQHGVIANGFYWRDTNEVEMWTAWNEKIQSPQIWDVLHQQAANITSAAWFPMLSKGCGANYVCMPAPIHNPDGSESLWCYTQPTELYGQLRDEFGHFPLQHFWGPLANISATKWIADSAGHAAQKYQPDFFYIYLPHLDYAAQRSGPDAADALQAVVDLDETIGRMAVKFVEAYSGNQLVWAVASEYAIVDVNHVTYPNRVLRDAGMLQVTETDEGEMLDFAGSTAWALVDHQFSHVFVNEAASIGSVADLFRNAEGIDEVLVGSDRDRYSVQHERSGEVILVSSANSWQAYYWWLDDSRAPVFARTVDIHRKPGYDPVELCFDALTKSIPLDAKLIRGSHGAPVRTEQQRGVFLTSDAGLLGGRSNIIDTDVAGLVLRQFGIEAY